MKYVRRLCFVTTPACGELSGHDTARPNGRWKPTPTANMSLIRCVTIADGSTAGSPFVSVLTPSVPVYEAAATISDPPAETAVPSPTAIPPGLNTIDVGSLLVAIVAPARPVPFASCSLR